jgi:serine phosphatase RsbU (regulator of sigma subunit)
MQQPIASAAFSRAALRSEQFRIAGMIGLCCTFMVMNIVRGFMVGSPGRRSLYAAWWLAFGAYETLMYFITLRAARKGRPVRTWVWAINTIVECGVVTFALVGLTIDKSFLGPYRALLGPPTMIYTLLIILSTLRLSPWLCVLTGLASAAGYFGVLMFTVSIAPHNPYRTMMPVEAYSLTPAVLLAAGVLAGVVAWQIRRHVIAALNEAETRRQLDRVEMEIQTARTIQMGLLPKHPPTAPGYDIAGWSQPASQTGGDFYDWIELPDGRVIFTIADATGHGIGPALLVAACRGYFRALASKSDPLEKITQQVDELIAADVTDGRFITAAVALLEPAEHRLLLYSAGHAPIYSYVAADDQVLSLDADQPPLGTRGCDGESQARVISMAPGDCLVLITDGFFEYPNAAGELLGIRRLAEIIRQHKGLCAAKSIQQMHQRVLEFSQGVAQGDDMTAVVIRRTAPLAAAGP